MQFQITKTIKILLAANFIVFLIQHSLERWGNVAFTQTFGLVPLLFVNEFQVWQILTYSFLHGDVMHLFLNLLMLAFIGGEIDSAWGSKRFLKFYFVCVATAGICYMLMQFFTGSPLQPMVGASGGVYGLLVAYGIMFGERVLLFMMLFPMKARNFVLVLAGVEFMTSVFSPHSGALSAVAHLGGMAAGFIILYGGAFFRVLQKQRSASKGAPLGRRKSKKTAEHLKLVINNSNESSEVEDPDDEPPTWH